MAGRREPRGGVLGQHPTPETAGCFYLFQRPRKGAPTAADTGEHHDLLRGVLTSASNQSHPDQGHGKCPDPRWSPIPVRDFTDEQHGTSDKQDDQKPELDACAHASIIDHHAATRAANAGRISADPVTLPVLQAVKRGTSK